MKRFIILVLLSSSAVFASSSPSQAIASCDSWTSSTNGSFGHAICSGPGNYHYKVAVRCNFTSTRYEMRYGNIVGKNQISTMECRESSKATWTNAVVTYY